MKHEDFPVAGFEFMNEPATDEQKRIIIEICNQRHIPIDPNGPWPEPFSKWDAAGMIETLKGETDHKPPTLAKFAGSLTGMAGGTIQPAPDKLELVKERIESCICTIQDGKRYAHPNCVVYHTKAAAGTILDLDDRCQNCKEHDNDGCPNCGPHTIKRVFNPAD